MFEDSDENMDVDEDVSRDDKFKIIQSNIDSMTVAMLESESSLPEFVRNSHVFKRKKEEFIENYVNKLFEASNSQDIAMGYSQLPSFAQNHPKLDSRLKNRKKEQLSTWRVTKRVNDTLKVLQYDDSQESYY